MWGIALSAAEMKELVRGVGKGSCTLIHREPEDDEDDDVGEEEEEDCWAETHWLVEAGRVTGLRIEVKLSQDLTPSRQLVRFHVKGKTFHLKGVETQPALTWGDQVDLTALHSVPLPLPLQAPEGAPMPLTYEQAIASLAVNDGFGRDYKADLWLCLRHPASGRVTMLCISSALCSPSAWFVRSEEGEPQSLSTGSYWQLDASYFRRLAFKARRDPARPSQVSSSSSSSSSFLIHPSRSGADRDGQRALLSAERADRPRHGLDLRVEGRDPHRG